MCRKATTIVYIYSTALEYKIFCKYTFPLSSYCVIITLRTWIISHNSANIRDKHMKIESLVDLNIFNLVTATLYKMLCHHWMMTSQLIITEQVIQFSCGYQIRHNTTSE